METKHTKGKWEVIKIKEGQNFYKVCAIDDKKDKDGKRLVLSSCFFEEAWQDGIISNMGRKESEVRRTKEQAEANAKLIAAAPELLEALIELSESYKYCVKNSEKSEYYIKAINAINKATK